MGLTDVAGVPSHGKATDYDDVVVDNTAAGVVLLQKNGHRKSALIINTGQNPMRITTDGSNPSPTHGKLLPAGASLALSPPYCPTDVVKACRSDVTNTTANASEVM